MADDPTIAGLNITKVSEGSTELKILIYGIPGAGKTLLAGSSFDVPEMQPMLYIDIEGGTETLRERYPDIEAVRVKNQTDKSGRMLRSGWKQLQELYEAVKKGEGGYTTVVVDNISEAYQLAMQDVMAKVVAENPDRDMDIPGLREYGKAGSQMRRWIRNLRDLDCHVILTGHEQAQTDDNGNVRQYTIAMPGKLPNEIAGFVDMVLYIYTKQDKTEGVYRNIQSQSAGKYIAKDRTGKLPLILRDPTMKRIYDIKNGVEV